MTAVVAIMNKSGIALAADSAVTVTNGTNNYSSSKIYNTANKLFMLSKYHPVGIMVYSSAEFMQVPWELIIKLYRKNLGKESFKTIEQYRDNFLEFILGNDSFSFSDKEDDYLSNKIFRIVSYILSISNDELINNEDSKVILEKSEGDSFNDKYIEMLEAILKDINTNYFSKYEKVDKFLEYTFDTFQDEYEDVVLKAFEICKGEMNIELTSYNSFKKELMSLVYEYLTRENFGLGSTGIVFAGFGESEIYPALCAIEIDGMFNRELRCINTQVTKIDSHNTASIVPFAQKDVMKMFIEGIDPNIEQVFKASFSKVIHGYNDLLVNIIEDDKIKQIIKDIDTNKLDEIFAEQIVEAKRVWQIAPTIDTVEILSKEDLAEMAESLIYLTFLKRRTSSSEESVGGPIDVAIISKGDGFIWKNRKHYFEKELNQHFFSNYYDH